MPITRSYRLGRRVVWEPYPNERRPITRTFLYGSRIDPSDWMDLEDPTLPHPHHHHFIDTMSPRHPVERRVPYGVEDPGDFFESPGPSYRLVRDSAQQYERHGPSHRPFPAEPHQSLPAGEDVGGYSLVVVERPRANFSEYRRIPSLSTRPPSGVVLRDNNDCGCNGGVSCNGSFRHHRTSQAEPSGQSNHLVDSSGWLSGNNSYPSATKDNNPLGRSNHCVDRASTPSGACRCWEEIASNTSSSRLSLSPADDGLIASNRRGCCDRHCSRQNQDYPRDDLGPGGKPFDQDDSSVVASSSSGSSRMKGLRSDSKTPRGNGLCDSKGRGPTTFWSSGNLKDDIFSKNMTFRACDAGSVLRDYEAGSSDIRSVPLLVHIPRGGKPISDSFLKKMKSPIEFWNRVSILYVIMPSRFQVGVARTLALPHGQVPLHRLLPDLISFSTDPQSSQMKVHLIGYNDNFSDDNISIRNDVEGVDLPWDEITAVLENIPKKEDESRQRVAVDIGFAGTQCVGRNARCDLGLAAPRMLQTSRGSKFSENLFGKSHLVDELLVLNNSMMANDPPADRVERWGSQLGENNKKEAARIHETEWSPRLASICAMHNDGQNGVLSNVTFCNRVYVDSNNNWKRQGAVFYYRKSVDDYELRRQRHGPYLLSVRSIIENQLSSRLNQSLSLVRRTDRFEIIDGLSALRIRCNVEVESYYQPFVSCLYRLVEVFGLNELQVLSCLLAFGQSLCSAAFALASTEVAVTYSRRIQGDVGYALLQIMRGLDKRDPKPLNVMLRFSKYIAFDHESERAWLVRVRAVMSCVHSVRAKRSSLCQSDYCGVHRIVMANLNKVGELRANHLVRIACVAGLLPLKLFSMVKGGASKAVRQIKKMFPDDNNTDSKTYVDNVHHLFETVLGRKLTHRYTENGFCKCGRVLANSDKQYWDIIDPLFPLVVVKDGKVRLLTKGNDAEVVPCIFNIEEDGRVTANIDYHIKVKRKRQWMSGLVR